MKRIVINYHLAGLLQPAGRIGRPSANPTLSLLTNLRVLVATAAILVTYPHMIGVVSPLAARAPDHVSVVGPGECAECHKQETEAWKATHHYKTFSRLPREKEATKIAKAMGFKRIKSGSMCLTCHFTSQEVKGKEKPVAGISCESCHSAAKDWLKRHSEYSGKKRETETPEEAKKRWADAEAAGMVRPQLTYALTKNCYSCHVVPEEKLVNQGGHPAGSPFEVVSWSQGEVRHNTWHNNAKENREAGQERQRMLYAVGAAVELETALRALATATTVARYSVTMAKRVEIAVLRLKRLARATHLPELITMVNVTNQARLILDNKDELNATADQVSDAAQQFANTYDGSELSAIDPYLPTPKDYRGDVRSAKPK